ncbi:SCAN domain-containing protein 3-like [Saccostrea cucullata]|uniref:SCAN domain-containing protein 3-like n=1 Tax=Saccostrea cuccullata TaxID=36930 RepID=UPI002ED50C63
MCDECQLRRKNPCKGVVVKPILSKDFNSRGQVDLIDMQSMADGNYRFIMNYQDHLTKFCILESLTSKRAAEVAYKLLTSVFFVFGAPHILQSDNGREFTANIILELKEIWPELVIVHGKPRHPQSQGSVERSNGDVHDMLVSWMRDNHTTKWSTGIKFVQFQKNRRDHSGIKRSPYEAMFGCAPKIGLSSSSIPEEILLTLQQEEDLQIHEPQNTSSENNNPEVSSQTQQSPPNLRRDPTETTEGFLLEFERECTVCNALFQTDDNNQNSCDICCRSQNIQRERHASASNMCKQAEKMITRSNQILRPVQVHDNVTIPIPAVDRGRGDPRNLLCLILEVDEANAQFKLGTKHGILHGAFSRNQFLPSSVHSLMVDDINRENEISVREAARLQSVGDGQGFMKCTCKSGCIRRTCKCLKANLLCNSRCHNSLSCRNK